MRNGKYRSEPYIDYKCDVMVERIPSGMAVDFEGSTPSLGTKKCRNGETVDASFSSFNIFRINYPND